MRTYSAEEMPDAHIEDGVEVWTSGSGERWLKDEGIRPERIEHYRQTAIRLLRERKVLWTNYETWRPMMDLVLEEGRRTLFAETAPDVEGWGNW